MKLILVFYIGIPSSTENEEVKNIINNVKNKFEQVQEQTNAFIFFLPVYDQNSRIECINPVLLKEEMYNEEVEKIKILQEKFNEVISKI